MLRLSGFWRAAAMTPRAALKVLSLSPTADLTHASIKKAYVRQTLQCHPDLFPGDPLATEKFRTLSDALRVALKALELRQNLGQAAAGSGDDGNAGAMDSQAALEALRRAIVAYRVHHRESESHRAPPAEGEGGDEQPRGSTDGVDDDTAVEDEAFFTPSLEYVSSVCRQEALAMRRVRAFCDELPAVLCGSRSAALFEAVAFFYARHVQPTSDCVMRFSKDLPVIVRRVVKNRRRHIRNAHTKRTAGLGTGARPRQQRIEDMAMKPLVLVGALVFDLPESAAGADRPVTSTCGVSRRQDIAVSPELQCTIHPHDSIAAITEKLGRWEGASYNRLKLELAIVDVCVLISSLLRLSGDGAEDDHGLAVTPHLHVGSDVTERVLLTLQRLACGLCDDVDEGLDHHQLRRAKDPFYAADPATTTATASNGRAAAEKLESILGHLYGVDVAATAARNAAFFAVETAAAEDGRDAAAALDTPTLIAECRYLARRAAGCGLSGSVSLSWDAETDLVASAEEVIAAAESTTATPPGEQGGGARSGFRVGRPPDCCAAESISFTVSVSLTGDLRVFLLRLRAALMTVVVEHAKGAAVLPALVRVRDATMEEEFIPLVPGNEEVPQEGQEGQEEEVEVAVRHRYRGPIHNVARLHNMVTARELVFWQRLHAHREYLASHAGAMSNINVYLDCTPGSGGATATTAAEDVVSGWIGESAEEDGTCDSVVLTSAELLEGEGDGDGDGGSSPFRQWLEDVVEQCSLSQECRAVLDAAGIGYISRDPTLPLANFLSFIKVFAGATAVRGVLEGSQPHGRVVQAEDIGIRIIVGHRCDVRDGGRLLVPWSMDPNVLIALLGGGDATPQLTAAGEGAAATTS